MACEIRYDRRALADLRGIHDYIAERNPEAARRVIAAIRASIGYLADNPLMGAPEQGGHGRLLVEPRYRYVISYAIAGATVQIRYVLHPSRDR